MDERTRSLIRAARASGEPAELRAALTALIRRRDPRLDPAVGDVLITGEGEWAVQNVRTAFVARRTPWCATCDRSVLICDTVTLPGGWCEESRNGWRYHALIRVRKPRLSGWRTVGGTLSQWRVWLKCAVVVRLGAPADAWALGRLPLAAARG